MSPPSLKPIEIRNFLAAKAIHFRKIRKNGATEARLPPTPTPRPSSMPGSLRVPVSFAPRSTPRADRSPKLRTGGRASDHVELHLVCASLCDAPRRPRRRLCARARRRRRRPRAYRNPVLARSCASRRGARSSRISRVGTRTPTRSSIAYSPFGESGDRSYAAFALRIRIAILLAARRL